MLNLGDWIQHRESNPDLSPITSEDSPSFHRGENLSVRRLARALRSLITDPAPSHLVSNPKLTVEKLVDENKYSSPNIASILSRITSPNPSGNMVTPPKGRKMLTRGVPEVKVKTLAVGSSGFANLIGDSRARGEINTPEGDSKLLSKLRAFFKYGAAQSPLKYYSIKGHGKSERLSSTVDVGGRNIPNISRIIRVWGKALLFWNGIKITIQRTRDLQIIWRYLEAYLHNHGALATVKIMKISLLIVTNFLAGNKDTAARELGSPIRMANGLPKWLPIHLRSAIRSRSAPFIRFVSSMLNSYKGFDAPYKDPDLSTITGVPFPIALSECTSLAQEFWAELSEKGFNLKTMGLEIPIEMDFSPLVKSSPQGPNSTLSAGDSAAVWKLSGNTALADFLNVTDQLEMKDYLEMAANSRENKITAANYHPLNSNCHLGKLSVKFEPAGKVRVFAIVDYWTQKALKPVHDWMFSVLRFLKKTDATFNQNKTLNDFVSKEYKEYYSYDLTAATDNIPQDLYKILFAPVMGTEVVDAWMRLLVGRTFVHPDVRHELNSRGLSYLSAAKLASEDAIIASRLPSGKGSLGDINFDFTQNYLVESMPRGSNPDELVGTVRYTRGQPMGALSSWSALALVHHFIVFMAAKRANQNIAEGISSGTLPVNTAKVPLFEGYVVLGDDIALAIKSLGDSYLEICHSVGIPINRKKSVVSRPVSEGGGEVVNFANQVIMAGQNISPASLREELSIRTWSSRFEFVKRLSLRGWLSVENESSKEGSSEAPALGSTSVSGFLRGLMYPNHWDTLRPTLARGNLPTDVRLAILSLLAPSFRDSLYAGPNRQAVQTVITLSDESNPLAKLGTIGGARAYVSDRLLETQFLTYCMNKLAGEWLRKRNAGHNYVRMLALTAKSLFDLRNPDKSLLAQTVLSEGVEARKKMINSVHLLEMEAHFSNEPETRSYMTYFPIDECPEHIQEVLMFQFTGPDHFLSVRPRLNSEIWTFCRRLRDAIDALPVEKTIEELLSPDRTERVVGDKLLNSMMSGWMLKRSEYFPIYVEWTRGSPGAEADTTHYETLTLSYVILRNSPTSS